MFSKRSFSMLLSAGLLATGLFFSACEDTVTPVDTGTPTAVTGVMMQSSGDSSIALKWTTSAYESNSNFQDYNVSFTDGVTTYDLSSSPLPKGSTGVDIIKAGTQGLKTGTEYTFTIITRGKDGKTASTATMTWSPAKRYKSVRVYESSSSKGSGMNLSSGTSLNIASGEMWDLCFDTKDAANFVFGSPNATAYTGNDGKFVSNGKTAKTTSVYSDSTGVGTFAAHTVAADSLNGVFESKALGTGLYAKQITVEKLATLTKGFVVYAKTQEGNYAKVYVKAAGGKVVQDGTDGKYLECDISVQTSTKPYAMFGGKNDIGTPAVVKAHTQTIK